MAAMHHPRSPKSPKSPMHMPRLHRLRPIRRKLSRAIRLSQHERALDDIVESGVEAEETTRLAIQAEVERVRELPPEDRARYGVEFTDPEALFAALEEADGEATILLRASWLRTLRKRTDRLPKRGAPLPAKATIGVPELRAIYAKATSTRSLPFIAVSHFWRAKGDPDPRGVTLGLIVNAL